MRLTDRERDRLLVYVAAELARRRRADGIALNHPETVAMITDEMMEAARRGESYESVLQAGRDAVDIEETMEGVPEMIDSIEVEVMMSEGMKLVSLSDPFAGT